jgi:hypothetical protein
LVVLYKQPTAHWATLLDQVPFSQFRRLIKIGLITTPVILVSPQLQHSPW